MSWETGTATNHTDLLNKLHAFLIKGHSLPPVYTSLGTGLINEIIGTGDSIQEIITVTFTSSTTFNVSGSVTGSMGSGTVGTQFTHAKVVFTISAGVTAWSAGDTISFVMTPPYISKRAVADSEYIWQAPGNDGASQIFIGAKVESNVSVGYYNWRLGGFTGYDSGMDFKSQPGAMTRPLMPLWANPIPYWFIADGRRVIVIAKITTQFEHAYLGLMSPYTSPGEWPYPLLVGGSMSWITEPPSDSINWRYSYNGNEHHAYFRSSASARYTLTFSNPDISTCRLRLPNGYWTGFATNGTAIADEPAIFPWSDGFTSLRPNLDGSVTLLSAYLVSTATPGNCYGEFSGVKAVSGFGRGSEDLVVVGRDTYLIAQDSSYTSAKSYAAFLLA